MSNEDLCGRRTLCARIRRMAIDITEIKAARERIRPFVKRTRLEKSETLSRDLGANVFVKYEIFQTTGAFKVRGAFNKILSLGDDTGEGIVAVSGGNHAQAVAYAASVLGKSSVIVMPDTTPANYLEATKNYGAEVMLCPTIAEAFAAAKGYEARGWTFVHPFDDPLVIAGQGTIGLEIIEDLPDVTDVFVSIGGGGLMSGVAGAVKLLSPETRVWGVETEGANAMALAMAAGRPVQLPAITSIAKTLGAPEVSERTLRAAQALLEKVWVVTDDETMGCLRYILERLKVLTEPAAAVTLAAAQRAKDNFGSRSNVVLIFCGGNFSLDDLCSYRFTAK